MVEACKGKNVFFSWPKCENPIKSGLSNNFKVIKGKIKL
jgi:hypothetical protein